MMFQERELIGLYKGFRLTYKQVFAIIKGK